MYAYVRSIDRQVVVNLSSVENSKLFTISTDWTLVYRSAESIRSIYRILSLPSTNALVLRYML